MKHWFIDTLDARAGLAFASHRTPDLMQDEQDLNALAVFIAPPDFQPETLASRATAIVAGRSSFQSGLFVGGAELAFRSLDDVVAFVRRLYVAGGGGDGGAGGGGGPPPLPPGEPPKSPMLPLEPETLEGGGWLAKTFKEFGEAVALAGKNGEKPSKGALLAATADFKPSSGTLADREVDDFLLAAATELAAELIARCPSEHSQKDLPTWLDSLLALQVAFDRLAMWEDFEAWPNPVLASAALSIFDARLEVIFGPGSIPELPKRSDVAEMVARMLLYGYGDLWEAVRRQDEVWRPWWPYWRQRPISYNDRDRFEDLGRWPLSNRVCRAVGLPEGSSTLADLLCLAMGAPAKVPVTEAVLLGLLLFAAMHLGSHAGSSVVGERRSFLRRMWRTALATRSLEWLTHQLPTTAFPVEIESLFPQAMQRQYV